MKILQIVGRFDPKHTAHCGINDYTEQLASALTRAGQTVNLLGTAHDRLGWGVRRLARLLRLVREWQPDIIHLQYQPHLYGHSLWLPLYPALTKQASRSMAFVTTFHSFQREERLSISRGQARGLLSGSDAVVVTNLEHRDQAQRALSHLDDRLAVIPVSANILMVSISPAQRERIRCEWGVEPEGLALVNFGFPRADKGLYDVIRALAYARAHSVPAIFVQLGEVRPVDEAYVLSVRRLADELDQSSYIRWLGSLPEDIVSACLQAADVYVAPYTDGFSTRRTSALVALAHGLPLVATRNEHSKQPELEHAVAFVPTHDPDALGNVLVDLAHDPAERQRLAEAGRRLSTHFDESALAGRHVEMYEKAIARARGAPRR
ncbi:MAG TPA: glycosyltransferase family 4 protein [Anaerolineae bacterium]|nr:glycosyltransferase family 4 protein [Anaerolineae bacterium]